jgi:hypothetical protein
MPPQPRSAGERFDEFVYPDPNSGCFIWVGAVARKGYGCFMVGSLRDGSRRLTQAHRFAWERANGPIPAGMCVLHKCDTPCCVNPDHMRLGTLHDNAMDMAAKGRGRKSPSGLPYGAHPHKRGGGFGSRMAFAGVTYHLGTFRTAQEASDAALQKKRQLHAEQEMRKMKSSGPDQTGKTQTLAKGEVPAPKMSIPPASKDGVGSVISST